MSGSEKFIIATAKAETHIGGKGIDTLSYENSSAAVSVDLSKGTGSYGYAEGDIITEVENVVGSDFADVITGDANQNVLSGKSGDDVLDGRDGTDTLIGGFGIDTASYENSSVSILINLATGITVDGDVPGDILMSIENIIGSKFNDTLIGDSSVNALNGRGGNDILNGGSGADTLDGGSGIDTVSYENSIAGVYVDLAKGVGSGGDATGDALVNIENIIGSDFADIFVGNGNANVLTGGDGHDTYVFDATRWGQDTIEDNEAKLVFNDSSPETFIVKKDDNNLSISKPEEAQNNTIKILNYFKPGHFNQLSVHTNTGKKYNLELQTNGTYKFTLAS